MGLFHLIGIEGILFGIALSYCVYIRIVYHELRHSSVNFPLLKTKLGFVLNNYGLNISASANGHIDKLVIGPLLGFTILGNYGLAIQVIGVFTIFSGTVFKYLLTHDATNVSQTKVKKLTIIISVGISFLGVTVSPLIIPEFFPKYVDAIIAVQIISLAIVPGTISLFYESKFLGAEKSRYVIKNSILFAAVLIIGMIVLGSWFGITGVAWSLVIATTAKTSFYLIKNF